ncbi:MAG: NUDIX hydrolase, partial [Candidatus Roizmanbacteria bacterium]|nr:NUDIX hydrolase [Candidatus Roizmanbacteria bacterium]
GRGIFDILVVMYEKYISILSVGAFIFNEKKQLLVVKKSVNEQIDAGLWTIPGGKIYPQEHILVGLRREVLEEVGLEIAQPQWIGEDVFQNQNAMFHAEHFMCKTQSISVVLEKKLTEYKWINGLSDIESLPFAVNIKKRIIEIFTKIV